MTRPSQERGGGSLQSPLLAYFGYPDGWWEPVPGNERIRYAFDATLLVLEGVHEYEKRYPDDADRVVGAQREGRDFLLRHGLYKVAGNDEVIQRKTTLLSFPPRWHYDILVALDHFRDCGQMGTNGSEMPARRSLRWKKRAGPASGTR